MKKVYNVLIFSMVINLVTAFIKIAGGILFNLSSLFADGFHTISDFITDFISYVGVKISNKKADKHHPFGYGRVEYLANIYIGMVLLFLALFIIYHGVSTSSQIPTINVLWVLVTVTLIKLISIINMLVVSRQINSKILFDNAKKSSLDLISTLGVVIITILLQFSSEFPILVYTDLIGTVIIGLVVLKTAIHVLVNNSTAIIGEIDDNKDLENIIKNEIKLYPDVIHFKIYLIKYGSYYKVRIKLDMIDDLKLYEVFSIENKIKSKLLRNKEYKIKYVTIFVA